MAYGNQRPKREMDDDTLVLFKNDDQRNDRDPLYKGQGRVDGRDYWVSAWVNKSKSGQSYMKIKVKPKQEARRESYRQEDTYTRQEPLDDEVPF